MHASMQSQLKKLSMEKRKNVKIGKRLFLMSLFVSNPSKNFMASLLSAVL